MIGDEMSNERNREIANDNYYRLKWLLEEGREFITELKLLLALSINCSPPAVSSTLIDVWNMTAKLRAELVRD